MVDTTTTTTNNNEDYSNYSNKNNDNDDNNGNNDDNYYNDDNNSLWISVLVAPAFFPLLYSLVKPFLAPETRSKIRILGSALSLGPTVFRGPRNFSPSRGIWVFSAELSRGI